jgi:exodeoxyribonuclease VII large subunit
VTQARPATAAARALSVAQVVARIRGLIGDAFPTPVWVEGEVSNCTYHGSGHIYFSLVDERVTDRFGQRLVLPCAFFRNANQSLRFKLEDGQKVLCYGEVAIYEARGQYQLRVLRVEPKGMGALQLAFEQLKKRLAAEGLFDEARKQPIPRLPRRVGVITSLAGSAIHDLLTRLRGHFAVVVLPVKVQGEGAAQEIAAALDLANARRLAQVLIVGRGGGSVEDLWAFNEEPVARALARSRIPVISAVGHEDDWTIADYVADLRASTPTHAAQLLVNERQALLEEGRELIDRLVETMRQALEEQDAALEGLAQRLRLLHPLHQVAEHRQRVGQWCERLVQRMRQVLQQQTQHLEGLAGRLQALSPLAVLARGYSLTFRRASGRLVRDAGGIRMGEELETRVARGRIFSTVTGAEPVPQEAYDGPAA